MSTPGHGNGLAVIKFPKSRKPSDHIIGQTQLEMVLGMRRELMKMEESIALSLAKGARVEPGIHNAELIPERRHRAGRDLLLKLVILVVFLAALPSLCSRASAFEDVNRDGKIDVLDFLESVSSPNFPAGKKECSRNA